MRILICISVTVRKYDGGPAPKGPATSVKMMCPGGGRGEDSSVRARSPGPCGARAGSAPLSIRRNACAPTPRQKAGFFRDAGSFSAGPAGSFTFYRRGPTQPSL